MLTLHTRAGKALIAAGFAALLAAPAAAQDAEPYVPEGCWDEESAPQLELGEGNVFLVPQWESAPAMVIDEEAAYTATIATNKGDLVVELNAAAAPMAVNNFICLAGAGFYDGTPFHRVVAGFMVQTGDPTGTGGGGPGYDFGDELPGDDLDYVRGAMAMANSGPDTQGSQFFIMHADRSGSLAKDYTIFGQLVEGDAVLDDIADSAVVPGLNGEPSRPAEGLLIREIVITQGS